MQLELAEEKDTTALGARLGRVLKPGDLLLLHGELGAGKTTLVRALARSAGYRGRVTSPTFALAHVYRFGRRRIHHLDLFRLHRGEDAEVGIEDLLDDERGIVVVEWPHKVERSWPRDRLEIRLMHRPVGRRVILKATGPGSRKILKSLK